MTYAEELRREAKQEAKLEARQEYEHKVDQAQQETEKTRQEGTQRLNPTAINLFKFGLGIEQVAESTGIPIEQVKNLQTKQFLNVV